jgi:ribulose-5-phosphate 4-epimerase/fuculose-1-phosphate aldolase
MVQQQPRIRDQVTPEEWEQRVALAAAYRLVAHFGLDDLIFTHLSALVNPYGVTYDEVTASNLVKVDLAGNKVMATPYPVNPAGFVIHSAIHAARDNVKCVFHVHSMNGVAVSAQKNGLLPISQQSIFVLSSLAYHDYEGVALREEEKPRLVRDLGEQNFFMLRNHGLITVADNVPDAFLSMYIFESACMIQVRALAGGGELIAIESAHHREWQATGGNRNERGAGRAALAGAAAQTGPDRPVVPRLKPRGCGAVDFEGRRGFDWLPVWGTSTRNHRVQRATVFGCAP